MKVRVGSGNQDALENKLLPSLLRNNGILGCQVKPVVSQCLGEQGSRSEFLCNIRVSWDHQAVLDGWSEFPYRGRLF